MLKTECPYCKSWVYSPLLTDVEETVCPDCGKTLPVQDVFVSAGPYAIYRDVLLKNIHKYTRLLMEAKKELADVEKLMGSGENPAAYRETSKTVRKFINDIEELLAGCREGLRITPENITATYTCDDTERTGKLVNISTTGMCLNVGEGAGALRSGQTLKLSIKDEAKPLTIELTGEIVWVGEHGNMGVKFFEMDKNRREDLWNFIVEKNRPPR